MIGLLKKLPFHLWMLGFIFINFDRVLTWELHGFTLKLSYFFFLASWLMISVERWRDSGGKDFIRHEAQHARALPWLFPSLLAFYALVGAPFSVLPVKSILYSFWLVFDVFIVAGSAAFLGCRGRFPLEIFYRYLAALVSFTALVILVDQIAYYNGHVDGLIGFNQDTVLKWGVSRPHAFTFEPSYAAAMLCLGTAFLLKEILFRSEFLPLWVSSLAATLGFTGLILTTARSGWLSFAGTLALMIVAVLLHFREKIKTLGIGLGVALAVIVLFIVGMPEKQRATMNKNLITSVLKMQDGSGNARLNSMVFGWTMAKESKFLGVGIGSNYAYWTRNKESQKYSDKLSEEEYGMEVVMSTWAQILAELGLPGLLLYIGFALSLIGMLLKRLVNTNSPIHGVAVFTAVVFFVFSAHWLSNVCRTDIWVWLAVWGVIAQSGYSDKTAAVARPPA